MVVVVIVVSVVPIGQGGRIGSLEGKKQEVGETSLLNFYNCVAVILQSDFIYIKSDYRSEPITVQ